MTYRKIRVREKTEPKVDHAMVARGLGAKLVNLLEISKEEAEQYQQLGSPVRLPVADTSYVYYLGARMLNMYGRSIDDVVGYRVLDADEEAEFRKQCGKNDVLVCYYGKK